MILSPVAGAFAESPGFRSLASSIAGGSLPQAVEGIAPSSFPFIVAALFSSFPRQIIAVTEHSQKMRDLHNDLSAIMDERDICLLPPWETLPYEFVPVPESIERERINTLYRLIGGTPLVAIATVESIIRTVPGSDFIRKKGMELAAGEEYPFDDIVELLVRYGFSRERRVEGFGHFAVKGGIIDVYLPSRERPVRLDFFGDTLESIREFDIDSQISREPVDRVTLFPRRELVLFDSEERELRSHVAAALAGGMEFPDSVAEAVDSGTLGDMRGLEDLFPLIVGEDTVLSYCAAPPLVVMMNTPELESRRALLGRTFDELHERKRGSALCLPPERLLRPAAYDDALSRAVRLETFTATPGSHRWSIKSIPSYRGRIKQVREDIAARTAAGWRVLVTTPFEGQARRLADLLSEFSPPSDFLSAGDAPVGVVISPLREGAEFNDLNTLVVTDHEIFGKSYRQRRQFKSSTSRPIDSFLDLKPGDHVVHVNHGIGMFRSVERMSAGGVERDFLLIEYAESDRLYVPLDQITLVQKYIGAGERTPRLDFLGKKSAWNRIKEKVRQSVEELASELIKIYSARKALKGFQFPPDTLWQEEFEALFEYEETPDQITAIEDVKDDMEGARPMDRLVCGDVGFGKTEVAIRAAFKAVMAGRQVAVLVPTTVLAMQHFNTFRKRFAPYPISVEMISRFRSAAEIKKVKTAMAEGGVDIIIGTHAILSKDISIKNLGLLIIDEEQRFGVKHKERLKKMRTMVDVLTLSATPIPRTLHMAMTGIRDLSTIMTPPENRQSIETYVLEENPDILRAAIMSERERGGQVFYVHNRVQTIEAQARMLAALVPEAGFRTAHGQMPEHELEEVMIDFLQGGFEVLVSTSIIESGLDMPNVNTIIINRADTFGLSQLYQLRGRVGRSEKKAYAYLFYPRHSSLTEDAQKRLQVISEYSDLGSGFKIAMKDLEIRGAGNILGSAQSGNIMEVGFELYLQMLDDAVRHLRGEPPTLHFRTPVFLNTDVYIPETYIADDKQKIEFYKRFEACTAPEEIDALAAEMTDRFGPYPDRVRILVDLEHIRALASSMRIDEILEDSRSIRIKITGASTVDPVRIMKLASKDRRFSIDPDFPEVLLFDPGKISPEKKLEELKKWLQQISTPQ